MTQARTTVSAQQQPMVALRTMSSDVTAIGYGQLSPKPELIAAPENEHAEAQTKKRGSGHSAKTVFLLVLLIAMAAAAYLWLYPAVKEALAPQIT